MCLKCRVCAAKGSGSDSIPTAIFSQTLSFSNLGFRLFIEFFTFTLIVGYNTVFVKGDRPDNAIELTVEVDGVPKDFWPVPVEIGLSDDYNVEIKSGVEEGMEVFTTVQTESGNNW